MYKFDEKKVVKDLVKWLKDWFKENGKDSNAIIGISGGKDSAVVASLCVKALGKDRVIGVLLPNGKQSDIEDSIRVCNLLKIKYTIINIKDIVNTSKKLLLNSLDEFNKKELSNQTLINLPARVRMTVLYGISQTLNGRVLNTCNLSEEWIGYSTRYGDAAGDVSPLANLTVTEVRKIGIELGLPEDLVYKTPSDGLSGKTDEDNLGFTYETLDKYIREGICEDKEIKKLIDKRHKQNEFKLKPIPFYKYGTIKIK